MPLRRIATGFSLVELLIALTIGLAVLAVLATVFSQTSSGRAELDRVSRLVENSRFASDVIGEDIRHAGFYGTFMPPTDAVFTNPSPCAWNTVDVVSLGWVPNATPPSFPAQLQGWDDPAAGGALPNSCLPDRVPGTDVIAIRRVSSQPELIFPLPADSVYVQASQCVSDAAPLVVSNASADFILKTAGCGAALANVRRYFVRVYYVASCNVCGGTPDGIRTLKRMEVVQNVVTSVSLAEGVENLQFEYAFDTVGDDGTPDEYRTDVTVGTAPNSLWSNVVAVRMHLLMRSTEPGLAVNETPGTFDLGPGHTAEDCPARFKCRLTSTTMRLNNVAGRREN